MVCSPHSRPLCRIEKYRPQGLNDIVGNQEIVSRLKVVAHTGNMPHLMLSGPPGVGKTTSILCLAMEMLGPMLMRDAVLELNASDDRGIETVRTRIKTFASKKVNLPAGKHKLIILDEADSMTAGAQQALRRIMELHANTTRFALACNLSSKIIEPIQSRCALLRYVQPTAEEMAHRLGQICEAEGIRASPDGMDAILFAADGDLRQAINNLQAAVSGFGPFVTADNVFRVCDSPHPAAVESIVNACLHGELAPACDSLKALCQRGYSTLDTVTTFFRVVRNMQPGPAFPELVQLAYIRAIGETHMRILEGSATRLQLAGMLASLVELSAKAK